MQDRKQNKYIWWGILVAGVLYDIWIRYTGIGIPCPFYKVTNLKCPGCGITRMILHLSLFQWKKAMRQNYFLFFTTPLIVLSLLYEAVWKTKRKDRCKFAQKLETIYVIMLVIWMVVRNVWSI